ncbi:hypothetical protein [Qipengyuania sphaerica]|uniref:hypothetical protein n=1 Tax=Qipengyuania sphaerica TaxID=2867243 RepID=UPI001C88416F|nr:hypothetical protein [Qipengyuania sphaerica]MBX7540203.1 hypothetical protein [Qipengyuania sphaerica]
MSKWSGFAAAVVLSLPILIYLGYFIATTIRIGELQLGYFVVGLLLVAVVNLFWVAVVAAIGGLTSFAWLALRGTGRARD